MNQYEYKVSPLSLNNTHQAEEVLTTLGADGWRVVQGYQNGTTLICLLERKDPTPSDQPYPNPISIGKIEPTLPAPPIPGPRRGRPPGSKSKPPEA